MPLLVPNGGERDALQAFLNIAAPENLVLRLFTNNITPTAATVAADLTEASGNGYSGISITPGNWSIAEGDPTVASYPDTTFTFTGALGNVYGYYITGATSGRLKWVERFSDAVVPFSIQNNGDQIRISPRMSFSSAP